MNNLFEEIAGDSFIPRTLSGSNEWGTPSVYVEAARKVMNGIELDPASDERFNKTVLADRYYTKDDDGLTQPWIARSVFNNPPYGRVGGRSNQDVWTCKAIAEYECGNAQQIIVLINACTGTACVQRLLGNYPICFVRGRIRFIGNGKSEQGPTHDNMFVYFGPNEERFMHVFAQFGKCVPAYARQGAELTLWNLESEAL